MILCAVPTPNHPQERLAIARELHEAQKRATAAERRAAAAEASQAAGATERRRLLAALKAANSDLKGLDSALTASDSQRRREASEAQAKLQVASQRRDETLALVQDLQGRLDSADRTAAALRERTRQLEETVKNLEDAHRCGHEDIART